MFFDPEIMSRVGLEECNLKLLDKGGPKKFYGKGGPTYASWTTEFISTFEEIEATRKVQFKLSGRPILLSYEEFDEALGISKQGTMGTHGMAKLMCSQARQNLQSVQGEG